MANRLVSVNEENELPLDVQAALVGSVQTHFETLTAEAETAASTATTAAATAADDAAAAEIARIAAENAASSAEAPTDSMVASLVGNDTSSTRVSITGLVQSRYEVFRDLDFASLPDALAAVPAGSVLEVHGVHALSATLVINKALTLRFVGAGALSTPTAITAVQVTSSNVTIRDAKITGTGNLVSGQAKGILVSGTVGAYLTNVHIINPSISLFNKDAIWLEYVSQFSVQTPNISDCAYSGIITISCINGRIEGGRIRNINMPTPFVNAYGVAMTRDSTKSMTDSPRSSNIVVTGVTIENVPWEGIDTHAGSNLTITNNTVLGCMNGIALVGCPNEVGVDTWAPIGMICTNNYIDGRVSNGSKANGIKLVGAGAVVGSPVETATGIISNNIVIDHGSSTNNQGLWGAINLYITQGVVVANNTITRPGGSGIILYHSNTGTVMSNNVFEDVWSTDAVAPAAIFLRSSHNTGSISGTVIIRGSKTATIVNARGLWANTVTNSSMALDSSNRFSGATLPVTPATFPQQSFFGTAPSGRPTGVAVTAAGIHAALVSLGLITA